MQSKRMLWIVPQRPCGRFVPLMLTRPTSMGMGGDRKCMSEGANNGRAWHRDWPVFEKGCYAMFSNIMVIIWVLSNTFSQCQIFLFVSWRGWDTCYVAQYSFYHHGFLWGSPNRWNYRHCLCDSFDMPAQHLPARYMLWLAQIVFVDYQWRKIWKFTNLHIFADEASMRANLKMKRLNRLKVLS